MAGSVATNISKTPDLNSEVGFGSGLDWDMTSNQGLTPLVNYNFNLQVEGIYNLPCKSVRVFQRENEYEILQEGGLNDYVHMLRKPISKPMTFQVERYVGIDMLDPLALGTDLALPVILMVSRYQGEGGNGVLDLSDSIQRMYTFTGCTVMAKEYGELNAERSGLLVETTTIAYREMICIDNPSTLSKRGAWSMRKDYEHMERDKQRKQAKESLGVNELTKAEMEEKAKMYVDKKVKEVPMHVLNYKGKKISTTRNAKTHENEIGIATKHPMASKKEREQAARRYFIPGSVSRASYGGLYRNSAMTNKDEVRKKEMERLARDGGADIRKMKPAPDQRIYDGTEASRSADTRPMTSKEEQMQSATRYFLPGSKSAARYMGKVEKRAAVNDAEVRKADMPNRKGGADIREMATAPNQRIYNETDGTRSSDAQGWNTNMKPAPNQRIYNETDGTRSSDKQGWNTNMKPAPNQRIYNETDGTRSSNKQGWNTNMLPAPNQRKYNGTSATMSSDERGRSSSMRPAANRRKYNGTVNTMSSDKRGRSTNMKPARNQRRYFLDGSKSRSSFRGIVKKSATVNTREVRKTAMQSKARQWPKTRSAADVAAFLKKR